MKNIFITFCIIVLTSNFVKAENFDTSIDLEIRKKYNVEELPSLPKAPPSKNNKPIDIYNISSKTLTIKNGTEIILVSKDKISSWNKEGTKISFVLQNQIITQEGEIIPSGTLFKAVVTKSHPPQFFGNGGLVELKFNEIYYNGILSLIKTRLKEVNSQKVITKSIKGKRQYWQNCNKAMTFGKKTFNTMKKAGKSLSPFPVLNILSIVPYSIGGATYILNVASSPIISIFMKGTSVNIQKDTVFILKANGNNQIKG